MINCAIKNTDEKPALTADKSLYIKILYNYKQINYLKRPILLMKQTLFSHCCCSDRSRTCYLHLMGVLCNHLHLAAMSLKKPPYPHGLGGTIKNEFHQSLHLTIHSILWKKSSQRRSRTTDCKVRACRVTTTLYGFLGKLPIFTDRQRN